MARYEVIIDVRINSREFPMDSLGDWRKFRQYLDRQINFFSIAPPEWPEEEYETNLQQESLRETQMAPANRDRSVKPRPTKGQRIIDLILGSLDTLGGRASIMSVIETMQRQGWVTSSPDPQSMRDNVGATIKKYPGTVETKGDVLILTPRGLNFLRNPETSRADFRVASAEKEKVIKAAEWVTMAGEKLSRPATGAEIYAAMVDMGFASTAKKPVDAVKTIMRANPDFKRSGVTDSAAILWEYKPADSATRDRQAREGGDTTDTSQP